MKNVKLSKIVKILLKGLIFIVRMDANLFICFNLELQNISKILKLKAIFVYFKIKFNLKIAGYLTIW